MLEYFDNIFIKILIFLLPFKSPIIKYHPLNIKSDIIVTEKKCVYTHKIKGSIYKLARAVCVTALDATYQNPASCRLSGNEFSRPILGLGHPPDLRVRVLVEQRTPRPRFLSNDHGRLVRCLNIVPFATTYPG